MSPYAVLGVERDATEAEIKSAYRKAAREHHPDVNPDDDDAAERFKAAAAAYEILGDPQKRAAYDAPALDLLDIVAEVFR